VNIRRQLVLHFAQEKVLDQKKVFIEDDKYKITVGPVDITLKV
jgi:hypothetical protein